MFAGDIQDTQSFTCFTHFSMCLYSHNEQLYVFRRYPRYSTIHMFFNISLCACPVIMSSCGYSEDIEDTQPSTCFTHFSMCLSSHNEQLCVFRRYRRYSTIHMFTHFSMCLYSHNEQLCVFRRYPRYSTIHMFTHFFMCPYSHNEQLCVFRRYPRYSTIHMFTHFSMCLYSHNEQLCVFRRYPRYSTIHMFTHFSTIIISSCVFSGDIQDTQPSMCFTHFSMCLYSHNEQLCVFRRYPRYSTIHVFYSFLHVPVQS